MSEQVPSKKKVDDSIPAVLRRRIKELRGDGYNFEFCNVFERAAKALEQPAPEPRPCCHDAPEGMHHPQCLNIGSPATRAAQPPRACRFISPGSFQCAKGEIHECFADGTCGVKPSLTKPDECAHLPAQATWCPKCSASGERDVP